MNLDLKHLEIQLKKRFEFPYHWGRKQSDDWDRKTNFIYHIRAFSDLQKKVEPLNEALKNYARNRWLNFWSAKGIEQIFATHPKVVANTNEYDKLVDFFVEQTAFDHKTSVFPKGFNKNLEYAQKHKQELLQWFYQQQSQQGRKHYKNRIFVVLYDKTSQEHWKLKAEIDLIRQEIETYLNHFSAQRLETLDFGEGLVFSDIIWVIK